MKLFYLLSMVLFDNENLLKLSFFLLNDKFVCLILKFIPNFFLILYHKTSHKKTSLIEILFMVNYESISKFCFFNFH